MFKINSTTLNGKNTYVIAEGGLNHNGDINIAKKLINAAKECGANAIKFQTYKTENFVRETNQYFDVFKNAELSFKEFKELKNYSESIGLTFFSTPFDMESAEFLNELGIPCFKIASSDLTNLPLITKIAKMQKPMIISSGLSTINEINDAVNCCLFEGNNQIAILHCVANYPTQPNEVNMNVINTLKKTFDFPIGYSDNGESSLVDIVAVSMGANIIEKHFTLDKKMLGPDHGFSIEPNGLKLLISQIHEVDQMKGDGIKIPQFSEIENRLAIRKSITAKRDLQEGEKIQEDDISIKRPADGIEPKYIPMILGKTVKTNIKKDSPIFWSNIS
jgi:N,N'-diacetyllegionaminate synthase